MKNNMVLCQETFQTIVNNLNAAIITEKSSMSSNQDEDDNDGLGYCNAIGL